MTSKELRHMNRTELLQMLLVLVEENEQLKNQLQTVTEELNNKNLKYDKVGSIAEAALQISDVFENADLAAQQYLQNIKAMSERQKSLYQEVELAAQKRAQVIISEANAYKEASVREADEYWNHVRANVREMMEKQITASTSVIPTKGIKK